MSEFAVNSTVENSNSEDIVSFMDHMEEMGYEQFRALVADSGRVVGHFQVRNENYDPATMEPEYEYVTVEEVYFKYDKTNPNNPENVKLDDLVDPITRDFKLHALNRVVLILNGKHGKTWANLKKVPEFATGAFRLPQAPSV